MLRVKQTKIGGYGLTAIILIALAVLLRIVLIALGWPRHNSDEAIIGLMALHINNRGELPIFFYGQFYMGATEAYVAAGLFRLFGASVFVLRLVPLLFFTLFLASMYLLTSLLYSKQLALVTLALLGLGSNIILQTEIVALGGYPEMLAFGALGFLLASWLALNNEQFASGQRRWRFTLGYALWGLLMGLGIWSDYIFAVFALMSGLLLLATSWRTMLSWRVLPFLLLGLLIGAFPLIVYNASHPVLNSWEVLQRLRLNFVSSMGLPHLFGRYPYEASIVGSLLISLPSITGAPPLCYDASLIRYGVSSLTPYSCTNMQYPVWQELFTFAWTFIILALWAIAVLQILLSLNRLRLRSTRRSRPPDQNRDILRYFARLALLLSAAFFYVQFALTPVAAVFPSNARYLAGLLVSTPAVIAPLWGIWREGETPAIIPASKFGSQVATPMFSPLLSRGLLVLAGLVLLWGSISVFGDIPAIQSSIQQENTLKSDLLRIHANHIYSDYWTCYRMVFDSDEAITCVGINQYLKRDHDRYPGYDAAVLSDPHAAYVFQPGSLQLSAVEQLAARTGKALQRYTCEGYIILRFA